MKLDLYHEKLTLWLHEKYLKKPGKLLDAGTGPFGGPFFGFGKLGYQVLGCDIEPADKKIKKVDLEKKWPYKSGYFDYVFMWHICEHLKNNLWFDEAYRCLKKGGKLVIATPDWETYHKRFYNEYGHCTPYTRILLKQMVRKKKFKIITNKIFSNIPILWRYTPRAFEFVVPFKAKSILTILEKR